MSAVAVAAVWCWWLRGRRRRRRRVVVAVVLSVVVAAAVLVAAAPLPFAGDEPSEDELVEDETLSCGLGGGGVASNCVL